MLVITWNCSTIHNRPQSVSVIQIEDTTPRVTGIGGIFFKAEHGKELKNWYGQQLGLAIDPYGSPFEFRNANHPEQINYLEWSIFNKTTTYFEPSPK